MSDIEKKTESIVDRIATLIDEAKQTNYMKKTVDDWIEHAFGKLQVAVATNQKEMIFGVDHYPAMKALLEHRTTETLAYIGSLSPVFFKELNACDSFGTHYVQFIFQY